MQALICKGCENFKVLAGVCGPKRPARAAPKLPSLSHADSFSSLSPRCPRAPDNSCGCPLPSQPAGLCGARWRGLGSARLFPDDRLGDPHRGCLARVSKTSTVRPHFSNSGFSPNNCAKKSRQPKNPVAVAADSTLRLPSSRQSRTTSKPRVKLFPEVACASTVVSPARLRHRV